MCKCRIDYANFSQSHRPAKCDANHDVCVDLFPWPVEVVCNNIVVALYVSDCVNDKVVKTHSISLSWDSWNVMSVNIPVACDHSLKWNVDHTAISGIAVEFIYSPHNSQRLSVSHWVILFTRQHLFTGTHYGTFHSTKLLHHACTQTFIRCISWQYDLTI